MYYEVDREKCKTDLLKHDQETRNDRAVWVKALESVRAYTGKQINKRICSKIEDDAPRTWQKVTRWNSEARQEETKDESFSTYHAGLEVDRFNYGTPTTQYKLTLSRRDAWERRRTFYFHDIVELVKTMDEAIKGADEAIAKLMELENTLDAVLDKYETGARLIEEVNSISGIYALREHVGRVTK